MARLGRHDDDARTAAAVVEQRTSERDDAQGRNDQLAGDLSRTMIEVEALRSSVELHSNERDTAREELQATRNELVAARSDLDRAEVELQSARTRADELTAELAAAAELRAVVEAELASSREQVASGHHELGERVGGDWIVIDDEDARSRGWRREFHRAVSSERSVSASSGIVMLSVAPGRPGKEPPAESSATDPRRRAAAWWMTASPRPRDPGCDDTPGVNRPPRSCGGPAPS